MKRFCSYLTAGLLLAHAVLGCCWHHAHAAEEVGADHLRAAIVCGCSHAADAADRAADSQPADHHDDPHKRCDQADCAFLPGDAPVQPAIGADVWFDVTGETAQAADPGGDVAWQQRGHVWPDAGTLRTHLALRVLLI